MYLRVRMVWLDEVKLSEATPLPIFQVRPNFELSHLKDDLYPRNILLQRRQGHMVER